MALGGCNFVVLHPAGDVAARQRDLLVESTVLMLLIIVPVMVLTVLFAIRYRQSHRRADYQPDWDHSIHLELVIWGAPLLIIICIGALTWMGTHLLDPYRPLTRIAAGKPVAAEASPLEVDVVALDWKWLFLYPQYGIGSVNELAAPVDRPISFRITSPSVMNSFYIPALAGQIYAMPGMETRLHAVANAPGTFAGFSANYSGAGFSGMHFPFRAMPAADFDQWVASVRAVPDRLDRSGYLALARPSSNEPVRHYAGVDPQLFGAILNLCVEPGRMCMHEMAAIDAKGGLGLAGVDAVLPRDVAASRPRAVFGANPAYVASLCTPEDPTAGGRPASPARLDLSPPLIGFGLSLPADLSAPASLTLSPVPAAGSDS
ncbi:MAG: ubiquinol oxidase subunit II [Rhizobiales bacterium]|nr:ubiquinol oxidase subunit II [Hyphomicrobiales bacterium]